MEASYPAIPDMEASYLAIPVTWQRRDPGLYMKILFFLVDCLYGQASNSPCRDPGWASCPFSHINTSPRVTWLTGMRWICCLSYR